MARGPAFKESPGMTAGLPPLMLSGVRAAGSGTSNEQVAERVSCNRAVALAFLHCTPPGVNGTYLV
jgi:hypothetical protein